MNVISTSIFLQNDSLYMKNNTIFKQIVKYNFISYFKKLGL